MCRDLSWPGGCRPAPNCAATCAAWGDCQKTTARSTATGHAPPSRPSPQAGREGKSSLHRVLLLVRVLPMPLLLQGVGNFLGHVGFVVLGEHVVGPKYACAIECAFRHDALPLAKQVRQNTLIGDRDRPMAVGHLEADRKTVTAGHASGRDEPAKPNAGAGSDMLLDHVGR